MRTSRLVTMVLVIALCLSAAAWGQDTRSRWQSRERPGGMSAGCAAGALMLPQPQGLENLATRLELSDEQKQKISAVLESAKSKLDPLRAKAVESVTALNKALRTPESDAAGLKAQLDTAEKAEAALAAAELDAWMEIRGLLKAEQIKKLGEAAARPNRRWEPGAGGSAPAEGDQPAVPPPPPPAQ